MTPKTRTVIPALPLLLVFALPKLAAQPTTKAEDNPDARPTVTHADVQIVQRAREILD